MGFFKYIISFWDDIHNIEKTTKGLIYAENYAAAAKELEQFYGSEIIAIKGLYGLEEGSIYDFDLNDDDNYLFTVTTKEKV